jgi:hypothetical protein
MQLGAALGCCGLLVHSLVDFNLHIPANAAWFAFCAGLASCAGSVDHLRPRSCNTKVPSEEYKSSVAYFLSARPARAGTRWPTAKAVGRRESSWS